MRGRSFVALAVAVAACGAFGDATTEAPSVGPVTDGGPDAAETSMPDAPSAFDGSPGVDARVATFCEQAGTFVACEDFDGPVPGLGFTNSGGVQKDPSVFFSPSASGRVVVPAAAMTQSKFMTATAPPNTKYHVEAKLRVERDQGDTSELAVLTIATGGTTPVAIGLKARVADTELFVCDGTCDNSTLPVLNAFEVVTVDYDAAGGVVNVKLGSGSGGSTVAPSITTGATVAIGAIDAASSNKARTVWVDDALVTSSQ